MTTFGANLPANNNGNGNAFEDYFATNFTSGTARRILEDVEALRANHPEYDTLGVAEQEALVNGHFIPESAVARYADEAKSNLPMGASSVYPRLRHPIGQKRTLIEDTAGSTGEDLDSASSSCVSFTISIHGHFTRIFCCHLFIRSFVLSHLD